MTERRPISSVLLPAVLLGLFAWLLTADTELGLNRLIWMTGIVVTWVVVRLRSGSHLHREERLLLLAVLGLSVLLTWRENQMLTALNMAALLVTFGLLPLAAKGERSLIWELRIGEVLEAGIRLVARLFIGLIPEVVAATRDARPTKLPVASLVRGAVFCAIVLPIFGGLLANADKEFGRFIEGLFSANINALLLDAWQIGLWSWLAAGLLGGVLIQRWALKGGEFNLSQGELGLVETSMVLGSLNVLFAAFIGFQIQHFFGGAETLSRQAGLTAADYARGGFFELVVVSALVLPLLLLIENRVRNASERTIHVFRALALMMIVLVFAIMASAMQRMMLYLQMFGLTEDRFFACAFIAGLVVTFGWLIVTVLRGRDDRFAGGAIVAWAAWLLLLNIANPDKIIVEHNLARAESGKELDVAHMVRASTDGVPAIVAGLDRVSVESRTALVARLKERYVTGFGSHDWRGWHYSRARAYELLTNTAS